MRLKFSIEPPEQQHRCIYQVFGGFFKTTMLLSRHHKYQTSSNDISKYRLFSLFDTFYLKDVCIPFGNSYVIT